nr:MAG TPA: hypothetical protein [Caudoviricetes sp.]
MALYILYLIGIGYMFDQYRISLINLYYLFELSCINNPLTNN